MKREVSGSPKGLRYRAEGPGYRALRRARLPQLALYCPICFGASDAPMALGMNWGVLTLLGVTVVVLGAFATFFLRLVRRSEREAEEGS